VEVAEVVYWGRTGGLLSESWKDYEIYVDEAAEPIVHGTFRMSRKPQRIAIEPQKLQSIRLKFLDSHGALNAGASEIAVYSTRPSKTQLDWFPLAGPELREHAALVEKQRAEMSRVASSLPGKVVFLTGARPRNELDWQAPMIVPPTATTPHYRVAAAFGLGQTGRHEAVPALLDAVNDFYNAPDVRHMAARALVKLCDRRDLEVLRETANAYPEVHTRRVLLIACEESEKRERRYHRQAVGDTN